MSVFVIIIVFLSIFLLITKVYNKNMMKNFSYNCFFSTDEAFEGDEVEFIEELTNNSFLPVPWIKSELSTSKWLDFAEFQSAVSDKSRFSASFFTLKSYSKTRRVWKVKCLKRGSYIFNNIMVVASDLFGMNISSISISEEKLLQTKITVLPVCSVNSYDKSNIKNNIGDIFIKNHIISDPFYINGVRDYTTTDSFQKINWSATAKEQKLMVNRNDFTTNRNITIILNIQSTSYDVTESLFINNTEICIKTCASLLKIFLDTGISVRLLSNTVFEYGDIPVDIMCTDHMSSLRILSNLSYKISTVFEKYLEAIIPTLDSPEIIIISPYSNEYISSLQYIFSNIRIIVPDISGGNNI